MVATSAADDAITGGAALGAGLIGGGFALFGNRQANSAAKRRDEDARLSKVRQEAAEDITHMVDLGAKLEGALAELLATLGQDTEQRQKVIDATSKVDARLDFIWDDDLRKHMRAFSARAREAAAAAGGEMRERAIKASEEWRQAKDRAGVVWRQLTRAVIDAQELLPDGEDQQAA
ncbi:MAG TPA: hypothetical protein VIC06_10340 [Solirubrobacteraceae bacterium]